MLPKEGPDVRPVPPYFTPTEVVAETIPLFACNGPFKEPTVTFPLKVLEPVNVLLLYVFGIVVEESAKYEAEVVENALPVFKTRNADAEVVEKKLFTLFQKSVEVVENERL